MLAPRRAVPEAKAGLPCFYRFFFVSFFGLLLAGGMAALGFLSISALLGSDCSASASWDLGMGTMMAKTQMSWKMAPKKSP